MKKRRDVETASLLLQLCETRVEALEGESYPRKARKAYRLFIGFEKCHGMPACGVGTQIESAVGAQAATNFCNTLLQLRRENSLQTCSCCPSQSSASAKATPMQRSATCRFWQSACRVTARSKYCFSACHRDTGVPSACTNLPLHPRASSRKTEVTIWTGCRLSNRFTALHRAADVCAALRTPISEWNAMLKDLPCVKSCSAFEWRLSGFILG